MQLQAELTFEHEMTKEKLQEMIRMVENAEKHSVRGQILRIKINHTTQFVFRNIYKEPVHQGIGKESPLPVEE